MSYREDLGCHPLPSVEDCIPPSSGFTYSEMLALGCELSTAPCAMRLAYLLKLPLNDTWKS